MNILKKVLIVLASLLLLILITVFVYIQSLKPAYSGEIKLPEAEGVKVYYDSIGVPHIFADTEQKAMVALGYVHAKERLWQMELLRRIASGRLSEILGKDLFEVDVFFSSLGIDETVEKQIKTLEKNTKVKTLVNAYLRGVNNYIDKGKTPVEFTLLGFKKEHYSIKDMYYVTAYMAFSFAHAFKTDPLLSYIKNKYGAVYLKTLAIHVDGHTFYQKNDDQANFLAQTSINSVLNKLPFPQFIGSNGWVLGPKKTTTGKVLFENDPHIGYAQPCVWYQAHIKTPDYENYGFYLGLLPFPLLAHNRNYAFGITMFENDDINFYQLKNHPTDKTKYITSTGEHHYEYVKKEVKIKGEIAKEITIKKTILGNIFNNQLKSLDTLNPITVQWVYNEKPSTVLQTSYGLNHVKNITNIEKELSHFSAPGLNYVYGDKQNNIALWSVGQLYKMSDEVNTKFVLNGLDSLHTQKTWVPFKENPKAINPTSGYVITSNTQPEAVNGVLFQGYYLSKDRGGAIEQKINSKEKLSVGDMKYLATSHTNTTLVENVQDLVYGIDIEKLSNYELHILDRLIKWKGNHYLDNIEPTIYYKLTFRILKKTFKDELGDDLFKDFVNTNLCKRTQNKYLKDRNSVWWDDINTSEKESFKMIVTSSFKESVAELKTQLGDVIEEWKWERIHTIHHKHALAKIDVLKNIFNVGPYSVVGGNETINNMMFEYNKKGVYESNAGPSTRRIIDFSDVENSFAILPTGQSGNFMSPYYKNQATDYNVGKYYKMLMNEKEIKTSKNLLIFKK